MQGPADRVGSEDGPPRTNARRVCLPDGQVVDWRAVVYSYPFVYTRFMTKYLIDLDEKTLGAARAELGTRTIKDTVNEALRRATSDRKHRVAVALDVLADARLDDRSEAWR